MAFSLFLCEKTVHCKKVTDLGPRLVYYRKENKSMLTSVRLYDNRHNQNLFQSAHSICQWSLEKSGKKFSIKF